MRIIPTRFETTLRLDLLGVEAARKAIQQPAKAAGIIFSNEAATKMVDDLRKVKVQGADGKLTIQPGPYIEPVQLQVVCYSLWEKRDAEKTHIEEADLEIIGNVDHALADYYSEQIATIATDTGTTERAIRDWFDTHLITEQGIRGQVLQTSNASEGLDNHIIDRLIDTHLVRAEKRRGVV